MTDGNNQVLTINKSLGWSMAVAVVGTVWFVGSTISALRASSETLLLVQMDTKEMLGDAKAASHLLEARVRVLENGSARLETRFEAVIMAIDELKQDLRQNSDILRQLVPGGAQQKGD